MTATPAPTLAGREVELGVLDRFFGDARGGGGGALVVRGEPGSGKTTLVEAALATSIGALVLRIATAEAEMHLDFAGLHQLLAPILLGTAELPTRQDAALAAAFGTRVNGAPNRLHVGVAALALLARRAAIQPVVCFVDDAHNLDEASSEVLTVLARRVKTEPIAFVFSLEDPSASGPLDGLPELRLGPLPASAARNVVNASVAGPLAAHVRERIVAETYGNPLALLDVSSELTSAQLAGSSLLPRVFSLSERLEKRLTRRVAALPDDTQTFLLLASAQPDGDGGVLARAAVELGLAADAPDAALAEGLIRIGPQVVFQGHFIAQAVYGMASVERRREAHAALARATDAKTDPEGRALHLADAAAGPDEEVAEALERSSERARERSGYVGAALLLERSAQLTPDPHRRIERSLAAVSAELQGGGADRATLMLADVNSAVTDELQRAQAQRLGIAIAVEHGTAVETPQALLAVARVLEPLDVQLARDAHLDALLAAIMAGRFGSQGASAAARIALEAPHDAKADTHAGDLLLDGLALLYTEGHAEAGAPLRGALDLLRSSDNSGWLRVGSLMAGELWDDERLHELAQRRVELARATGARFTLRRSINFLGVYETLVGRFDVAAALLEESRELEAAILSPRADDRYGPARLILAAWRGRELETRMLAEKTAREATSRGDGAGLAWAKYATAVLELSLGRYREALEVARSAAEDQIICVTGWTLPELIEAAVRSGEHDEAAATVERLSGPARAAGTDWGLGMLARARALVAEPDDARALHEEAIDRLGRCRATTQLARARLLYGEWLRRSRHPRDARGHLRAAHEMFTSMGANAFAERARAELAATGERPRRWTVDTMELLTPQEARIAELVSEGASNSAIAAQLYISSRTVEYHLSKIFRKVGVSSRTQLTRSLIEEPRPQD